MTTKYRFDLTHVSWVAAAADRLAWVFRVSAGFVTAVLAILAILISRLPLPHGLYVLTAAVVMCAVGLFQMKRAVRGNAPAFWFLSVASTVDVAFTLVVVWFCCAAGQNSHLQLLLMGGFCVAITLSTVSRVRGVVLLCGGLAIVAYALVITASVRVGALGLTQGLLELSISGVLLALLTVLGRSIAECLDRADFRDPGSDTNGILDRLPQVVCGLDARGCFVWANSAVEAMLGIAPSAVPGRFLGEFLVSFNEVFPTTRPIHGTWQAKQEVVPPRYVLCSIWPAAPGDDSVRWEGVLVDVTDRQRAEREREEMVERLHRYQKMESLGTLAGGMAHDFNNVLQVVGDVVDDVAQKTAEQSTLEKMKTAQTCLGEARFLVSQLLSIGSSVPVALEPVDLCDLISRLAQTLKPRLSPQHVLTCTCARTPMFIRGDKEHVRRVFENLVYNARDAMVDGGTISIEASVAKSGDSAETVVVRVCDTGCGIAPEIIDRVFDPFVTTKGPGKGTGLGLALVQHVLNLHKATINVEKTSPSGTTFKIEFPSAGRFEINHDTRWMVSKRQKVRILIVDDDPKIRDVLKAFLRDLKYDVSEAANLEQARAEIDIHKAECRIVVMDWSMDGLDPRELIAEMRKIVPGLLFIVISGYPPDERSVKQLGIRRWFTKPYDRNLLDLEIQRALYLDSHAKSG